MADLLEPSHQPCNKGALHASLRLPKNDEAGKGYGEEMDRILNEMRLIGEEAGLQEPLSAILACYPGSEDGLDDEDAPRYRKHLDNYGPSVEPGNKRELTIIMYLNLAWGEVNGGQFRAHLESGSRDISPHGGDMIIFESTGLAHEVLPASRSRFAVTLWMEGARAD